VDTNAEADALVSGEAGVRFGESSLCLHRALHRFHSTPKLSKNTVSRRVHYAAPVFPNEPVEDCAPFGQTFERPDLVEAHEAAVALHIGCEDGDEASADCDRV
jgi:hypothetical protein